MPDYPTPYPKAEEPRWMNGPRGHEEIAMLEPIYQSQKDSNVSPGAYISPLDTHTK